jgi:hypothetical protein
MASRTGKAVSIKALRSKSPCGLRASAAALSAVLLRRWDGRAPAADPTNPADGTNGTNEADETKAGPKPCREAATRSPARHRHTPPANNSRLSNSQFLGFKYMGRLRRMEYTMEKTGSWNQSAGMMLKLST